MASKRRHEEAFMTKRIIAMSVPIIMGGLMFATLARAQSSQMLIPYGMSAGMQLLNRAVQPAPRAAPTPVAQENGYGAQIGDRRLVCEQWSGERWIVIPVAAKQCVR
jgi:hypothetical protein